MTPEELRKNQAALSAKVMSLAAGTLMLNLRYMSKAVSRLPSRPYEGSYACSGSVMQYDPAYLLARYKQDQKLPVHDCLHMLLHCVFRHWSIGSGLDALRWDAACDIAVESTVMKIARGFCSNEHLAEKSSVLLDLSLRVSPLTAEKLYAFFASENTPEETLREYSRIFSVDVHDEWYPKQQQTPEDEEDPPFISPEIVEGEDEPGEPEEKNGSGEDSPDDSESTRDRQEPEPDEGAEAEAPEQDEGLAQYLENERQRQLSELDEMWRELAKEIKSELEDFGKRSSDDSAYMVQMLKELDRERGDYTEFLRRFAVTGEVIRADLDAFEPGFYSYGLQLYGNVALIEPPEYKETQLIRDFVIAIDTSGSVSGDLVQRFMQETYSILKSTESFFARVNIYIIQCDTEVRDAALITSEAELDKYISKAELRGLGGTDFRPVFDYIETLRGEGRLSGLKGLVYFTDGEGTFPERRPDYETAFVFIGDTDAVVPAWAMKIVMDDR